MAALRIMPQADPGIPPQTAAEVRAYCKAWGIHFTGPALAQREYRTGPHPKSARGAGGRVSPTYRSLEP